MKPISRIYIFSILFILMLNSLQAQNRVLEIHIYNTKAELTKVKEKHNEIHIGIEKLNYELAQNYSRGFNEISILLHKGKYYISQPINFNNLTAVKIEIKAFNNEKVIISGAEKLSTPTPLTSNIFNHLTNNEVGKLREVQLSFQQKQSLAVSPKGPEFIFLENDKPLIITQFPEKSTEWLFIENVEKSSSRVEINYETTIGLKQANHDAFLFGYWNREWYGEHQRIESWNLKENKFVVPSTSKYGYGEGHKFRIFNIKEKLNAPGKMYLNFSTGKLYFWPFKDNSDVFIAKSKKNLLYIKNCKNINISDINFTENYQSAIVIRNSSNITINNTRVSEIILNGIEIHDGNFCKIKNSEIYSIGAKGVILSGGERENLTPSNHLVENCHIHGFAKIQRVYQPAIELIGVGNTIRNCYINNSPHQGVLVRGNNHLIEYCKFEDLGTETGDVGAVYTSRDWSYRGNVVRHNYFKNLIGTGKLGAVGVYLDDMSSGFLVYGNIFENCYKAIQIGGGRDNIIENNVFINSKNSSVKIDNRAEKKIKSDPRNKGMLAMVEKLKSVPYKSEKFKKAYPKLYTILEESPYSPLGNKVQNNILLNSVFFSLKPNSEAYWEKILLKKNNIVDPPIDLKNHTSNIIDKINILIKSKYKGFNEIEYTKMGLKNL